MSVNTLERRALTRPVKLVKRSKKHKRADDTPEDRPQAAADEGGDKDDGKDGDDDQADDDEPEESEDEPADEGRSDGPGTLEGYAAVFHDDADPGTEYELWNDPGFRAVERVARGAFSRAIKEGDDCRACFNHEPDALLGRTSAGTCRIEEDERGLRYEVDLPDTTVGRDVAELVSRGDVTGSSFGFVVEQESWRDIDAEGGQRLAIRTIESVRLMDVGPVTYPAYSATSAGARSAAAPVRAIGSVAEARASYERWKERQLQAMPLGAWLAQVRSRAVAVAAAAS